MVHGYQMYYFFKDEGHIHLSYSNFTNQYGFLTCVKYKKTFSLPSADRIRTVSWKLRHTKNRFIVSVSIYNLNYDKSSFSKRGRRGMINFWKDEI